MTGTDGIGRAEQDRTASHWKQLEGLYRPTEVGRCMELSGAI